MCGKTFKIESSFDVETGLSLLSTSKSPCVRPRRSRQSEVRNTDSLFSCFPSRRRESGRNRDLLPSELSCQGLFFLGTTSFTLKGEVFVSFDGWVEPIDGGLRFRDLVLVGLLEVCFVRCFPKNLLSKNPFSHRLVKLLTVSSRFLKGPSESFEPFGSNKIVLYDLLDAPSPVPPTPSLGLRRHGSRFEKIVKDTQSTLPRFVFLVGKGKVVWSSAPTATPRWTLRSPVWTTRPETPSSSPHDPSLS